MQITYQSKHNDRLTLHVTCEIYKQFQAGAKTTEYRPVNGHYFNTFEKIRTMYRISPHYRCTVRIYEAYKSRYIDFVCMGITIKSLSECPQEVSRIYGTLYTAFYALHLIR